MLGCHQQMHEMRSIAQSDSRNPAEFAAVSWVVGMALARLV